MIKNKENNIKVSIIVPYNAEKTIQKAIKSALKQTVTNEIIIINDGSTDKTSMVIGHYKNDNIVIINNEKNIGPGLSRNKGLKIAKGQYIFFLDSDDILPYKKSLMKMVDACE